jgi:hypothetical protein
LLIAPSGTTGAAYATATKKKVRMITVTIHISSVQPTRKQSQEEEKGSQGDGAHFVEGLCEVSEGK